MKYFRPISISLSPNVEKDDVKLALNLIIRPWLWMRNKKPFLHSAETKNSNANGSAIETIENEFKKYLGVKYAISFNSGRSAFYAILKVLDIPKESNVAIQAFTCNAVVSPILWAGLNPLYIDCNKNDFNISTSELKSKINTKTRAVLVQHTFGLPANMDEIRTICAENNLILIEDCAHSLGAEYNGVKVGSQSKVAFFSFSRDKVISSVYGGIAVTNDPLLGEKLLQAQGELGMPSLFWIFQQILHPILLHYLILPIYNFLNLGKLFLVFSQITHILSKAVSWQEKRGQRPDYFPKAMPNALAIMALNQFKKLDKFNNHRQEIAQLYYDNLKDLKYELPKNFDPSTGSGQAYRKNIFLRFTIKHPKAHEILYDAWHKQNILLGDWYTTPIAPFDTKTEEMKYILGSCPNAESLAKQTFNLPTHINISYKEVVRIVNFLKKYK